LLQRRGYKPRPFNPILVRFCGTSELAPFPVPS
jgi:hypothetical protein